MFGGKALCFYLVCFLSGFCMFFQKTDGSQSAKIETFNTTGKTFFLYQRLKHPRDCVEVLHQCRSKKFSGVYFIKPDGYPKPFEVYCDNNFETGGWTVLMRRFDGSIEFSRSWEEYKKGFGFLSSEFWLGHEKLAHLTKQRNYELRIDLTVSNGSSVFLKYSFFSVNDELGNYRVDTLGTTRGNTSFLAPICPNNTVYTNCVCEKTCETPTVCKNNCHTEKRCVCPDGFFLKGSDCVTPEECDCYSITDAKVITVWVSYISNQCSERCVCDGHNLTCYTYSCDTNAVCRRNSEGGRCICKTGFIGDGVTCRCQTEGYLVDGSRCRLPRDCDEVPSVTGYRGSGVYYILPTDWQEFQVYCNMSEGRWTVFQRRFKSSERSFFLGWNSYKNGFGILEQDFWLGNEKIHYLTNQRDYELRIDITDNENRHYRALYTGFRIGDEESKYRMVTLGSYSGNAGYDAMRYHVGRAFSTRDEDNDDWDGSGCYNVFSGSTCYNLGDSVFGHCTYLHEGGWWYKYRSRVFAPGGCDYSTSMDFVSSINDQYESFTCCEESSCINCGSRAYSCAYSNLNGNLSSSRARTIFWHGLSGNDCGIESTEMKLRPL